MAVDTANHMVQFAEDTHKVLTAAQAAGGVGIILQTGATLLTEQGMAACAKYAAQTTLGAAVSGTAAAVGNYALDQLHLDPSTRHWIQVGLDAYQVFSFLKAARSKVVPGGQCFVAGTQVVTAINADGSYVTKSIEDVKVGDTVLSRDQYNESDDLSPHQVTETFAHTVDHVRVLTIRDVNGNVETIRTTDTHPFYVEGLGWMTAGELKAGQRLNEADDSNDAVVVSSVREEHPEGIKVYNFTVDGDHTYFVENGHDTTTAIWVHNNCPTDIRPYIKDFAQNEGRWKLVRTKVEAATGMRNNGGQSMQELFRNESGIEIVRHTLFKPDGTLFGAPHFRGYWE